MFEVEFLCADELQLSTGGAEQLARNRRHRQRHRRCERRPERRRRQHVGVDVMQNSESDHRQRRTTVDDDVQRLATTFEMD